ncbi:hypothetical protein [Ruania zhangjianzhongii]|uniref:hypothetical protein n=1 Tax=Ruania zhangjianzhongii TaxID=2603206 RepID=UPI0011C97B6E|nr:hypothetical protein [Ruania zhangjianzhongii]
MSRSPVRTALTAVAAITFALVGLTGCTSTSYSCSGGSCSITLKGEGASTEIDPLSLGLTTSGEITFELVSIAGSDATFAIGGTESQCAAGDQVSVGDLSVTCTAIADGALELTAAG